MTNRKPTLGYTSRTEAVLALRKARLTTRQIAARIGIDPKVVIALEHSAGRARKHQTRPAEALVRTVLFPTDLLDGLAPHAARRGIHPNTLARRIVETVIESGIIDAVLNDADEDPASPDLAS